MADLNEQSILVVDDDDAFLDEAKRLFEGRLSTGRTIAEAARAAEAGQLHLLILGPSFANEAALRTVEPLLAHETSLPAVLVASAITAPILRAAMRTGLKDVVEMPLTEQKVSEALGHFGRELKLRGGATLPSQAAEAREGVIVTVISAKGGSGKTVVATNLALLLALNHDANRVCIVDADLQFGDVCLVLQLEPRLTIVNAAHEMHRLDKVLLESLLTRHSSGLRVLAAPLEPAFADEISTGALMDILGLLRQMFDYIVVDTASLLDELLLSLLERADQILMVVDMDLPSVKNAKLALETLRLLKFPTDKVQLVLNRSNAKARLDEKEIERSLKGRISAAIPSDGMVPASINEGKPVVLSAPKSRVAAGYKSVYDLVAQIQSEPTGRGLRRRK